MQFNAICYHSHVFWHTNMLQRDWVYPLPVWQRKEGVPIDCSQSSYHNQLRFWQSRHVNSCNAPSYAQFYTKHASEHNPGQFVWFELK